MQEGMQSLTALQTGLKDLFEGEIFGDQVLLKTPKGEMTTITGYEQDLPKRLTDGEDSSTPTAEQYAPFFVLQLNGGSRENSQDPDTVDVEIIFCVYDNNDINQGHKDVLNLIEKAIRYLEQHPTLLKACSIPPDTSISWTLADEDSWPYFFGSISFSVQIPRKGVESEYI